MLNITLSGFDIFEDDHLKEFLDHRMSLSRLDEDAITTWLISMGQGEESEDPATVVILSFGIRPQDFLPLEPIIETMTLRTIRSEAMSCRTWNQRCPYFRIVGPREQVDRFVLQCRQVSFQHNCEILYTDGGQPPALPEGKHIRVYGDDQDEINSVSTALNSFFEQERILVSVDSVKLDAFIPANEMVPQE